MSTKLTKKTKEPIYLTDAMVKSWFLNQGETRQSDERKYNKPEIKIVFKPKMIQLR